VQRRALAEAAERMPGGFTADELLAAVREREPGIGVATVYRALAAMAEAGFLEQVGTRDGAAVYARCRSGGHHHHVVCTSCGAVAEADCGLDEMLAGVERASGYDVTSHELTLRGLCPRCRKAAG
jgi:Fur family ferric uptake transcriptional regulator